MDWKKVAPWNWFKDEESRAVAPARSPSDPFSSFRTEMERLFESALGRFPSEPSGGVSLLRPSLDISEGKKTYTVRAELPGVERDDISVEVEERRLVIRAEKRQEREEDEEGYHCVERSYGRVQRVLSLPEDADADQIDAKFKNGVLKLQIAKQPARASGGRSIEVGS